MADSKEPENQGTDENQEDEKKFGQKEVDAIVKDRLAREKEKYKDYDDLKKKIQEIEKKEKANLPEIERLRTEVEEKAKLIALKEEEIKQAQVLNLKLELLDAEGLPKFWAKRILGQTEEEIKADIAEIKKLLGEKKENVGKGTAPAVTTSKTPSQYINDVLRGKR